MQTGILWCLVQKAGIYLVNIQTKTMRDVNNSIGVNMIKKERLLSGFYGRFFTGFFTKQDGSRRPVWEEADSWSGWVRKNPRHSAGTYDSSCLAQGSDLFWLTARPAAALRTSIGIVRPVLKFPYYQSRRSYIALFSSLLCFVPASKYPNFLSVVQQPRP